LWSILSIVIHKLLKHLPLLEAKVEEIDPKC
ncbi:unnamed protein product, partial [marine sediment metagenome]